ncbi:sulfonate transport system substrate-binding protein [Pseudonocardia ammonioxydans]|uniref:Putative aliphatic sulfonates-binding protein n=1 Tax=Pseudonocardia ammonioxydans TaxID=260086 RepID=A0A1I5BFV3_PSUAM|nr:ABC transporter substrate-binding protein [Pseudonocardia ammonioxydans]SFN73613.1 sulfonate transport system substrate-binding protein [Pseudonocardia ammonioxydans]
MPREAHRVPYRWVLPALLAALTLTGCSSVPLERPPVQPPVDDAALAGVTLHVGDQKGGSQSLLRAAGLLEDLPYRIEWRTFTSGPPLIEAARAGAIDVGATGNTPAIFAAAAKARVQLVAANRGNVTSDAILVREDSPHHAVEQLRGTRIAVAKGSSAHGQLLYTLRAAGLTLDDVDLTFLAPADAFAAWQQGEVDAWAVWDPYTAQAEAEGGRVLADGEGTANGFGFQVASNAALADPARSAAVADLLARVAAAQTYSDTHRAQRAEVWSAETGLPLAVTRRAVDRGPDLPIPFDDGVVASQQALADAFSDAGVIPGRADFAALVDRRFEPTTRHAARTGIPGTPTHRGGTP